MESKSSFTSLERLEKIEYSLRPVYKQIDACAFANFSKVLAAFQKNKVSQRHFYGSTGYGYGDDGRDTLNKVFASIVSGEAAIVSPYLASGTHALTVALFGLSRPGGLLLSITGEPYDTLKDVISKKDAGSLKDYGVSYKYVPQSSGITCGDVFSFDLRAIEKALKDRLYKDKVVFIQRSKGYSRKTALSADEMKSICAFIKGVDSNAVILVDNCYCEFTDTEEPLTCGADVIAGSMIKNPGGGLAPTGGYIAGEKKFMEKIANRFTAPSIGTEITSYISGYLPFYQGLFFAPSVTAAAMKGCALMTALFSELGYETAPKPYTLPRDIVSVIEFPDKSKLLEFMKIIQKSSPVDSFATPEPWAMPGYEHEVVMAAGCFVGGASIELSADAPIKTPYTAYVQGGLTYEHVRLAALSCIEAFK